jgi:hypothetical protein
MAGAFYRRRPREPPEAAHEARGTRRKHNILIARGRMTHILGPNRPARPAGARRESGFSLGEIARKTIFSRFSL